MALLKPKLDENTYIRARRYIVKQLRKRRQIAKIDDDLDSLADVGIAKVLPKYQYGKGASLLTWLCFAGYKQTVNEYVMQNRLQPTLKKYNPLDRAYQESELGLEFELSADDKNLRAIVDLESFEHLIKSLNPTTQQIFRMVYVDGLRQYEIADKLGMTVDAIEARLFWGKKFLRDKLSNKVQRGQNQHGITKTKTN